MKAPYAVYGLYARGPILTRSDRRCLGRYASGQRPTRRVWDLTGGSVRQAGLLAAVYDRLTADPVAEMSPLRRISAVVILHRSPYGDRTTQPKES